MHVKEHQKCKQENRVTPQYRKETNCKKKKSPPPANILNLGICSTSPPEKKGSRKACRIKFNKPGVK